MITRRRIGLLIYYLTCALTSLSLLSTPANADCGSNGRAVSIIGGTACVCQSGYTGVNCGTAATCTLASPESTEVITNTASILNAAIDDDDLWLTFQLPMTSTRNYTAFRIGTCPESYFTRLSIQSIGTSALTCYDTYSVGLPVTYLTTYCGFNVSQGTDYERFNGTVYASYTEVITLDDIQQMYRTNTIDLPVSVSLQSTVTSTMSLYGLKVYSKQRFDAALTGQRITTASTASVTTLTYMVQFPYQVFIYIHICLFLTNLGFLNFENAPKNA